MAHDNLMRVLERGEVKRGDMVYVRLRRGAIWQRASSGKEKGFILGPDAPKYPDMPNEPVYDLTPPVICQGAFMDMRYNPNRVYLTPFYDLKTQKSFNDYFIYKVDENAAESIYSVIKGLFIWECYDTTFREDGRINPYIDNPTGIFYDVEKLER